MGVAKCPYCGHVHGTSFEVKKTKEYLSGTSHPSIECDGCGKRFVIIEA